MNTHLDNPFKPGAGHSPPYLAGRDTEKKGFADLLKQKTILSNLVLTGLRGVGKTVLLEEFKPIAQRANWVWVGTDFSESTCVNEETLAIRLITDLSVFTSSITFKKEARSVGFSEAITESTLSYSALVSLFKEAPGLVSDKLKYLLNVVWKCIQGSPISGIVFAYDEAQTMSDHASKEQYPLSLLLDVFQSIQKSNIPFMLVLAGLPTLFPKLVEARTFAERMFQVQILGKLSAKDSKDAITKPIQDASSLVSFSSDTVTLITETSGGYPFFIQFICKELFDVFRQQIAVQRKIVPVPMQEIVQKLDKDFFSGRWARSTDRQRELLSIISQLEHCDDEFTVQEIVEKAKPTDKPFSASHVNQMLAALGNAGLVYKNRYGKYAFAVPLLGQFIRRQERELLQPLLPGLK
jgi:AAA ATPase domain